MGLCNFNPENVTAPVLEFLRNMAEAQDRRFKTIESGIAGLQAEIKRLKEELETLKSAAVVQPQQVSQQVQQADTKVSPVSEPANVQNATMAPKTEVRTSYAPLYFGSPDGPGFESGNYLPGKEDSRALYVVEQISNSSAKFYPMTDRFQRLRSNASAFFLPMCIVEGDLADASSITVEPDGYGTLVLEDGYWSLETKCKVSCN